MLAPKCRQRVWERVELQRHIVKAARIAWCGCVDEQPTATSSMTPMMLATSVLAPRQSLESAI